MNNALKALKLLISWVGILSIAAVCLPLLAVQAASGPGAIRSSVSTYEINILDPYLSGMLANLVVTLPVTLQNTGSSLDQYGVICSKDSGGVGWSVSLLDSSGQVLIANCLTGTYFTTPVSGGESLPLQVRLAAPFDAPIGDYLKVNITATSGNDPTKFASVLRQAAVSAPFIQDFSDNVLGRNLQISNPKFFFTRAIGPRIEWPNSLAVTYVNNFTYINAWGYGLGTHVNIEYEVMNIRSGYPPSVVQLTDNPDRTVDHSISLSTTSNKITGVGYIRTIYDPVNSAKQKQNVYFARIDARGLPQGLPVNVTNNPYFGVSNEANVPFFSGVSIRATSNNRFILTWVKQENNRQDIWKAVYDTATQNWVVLPQAFVLSTGTINYFGPILAGLDTSAQTFLTYIANDSDNPTTPISLWGAKLDNNGEFVGSSFLVAAINGSKIDAVQLWDGNILATWIDEPSKSLTYAIWDTSGTVVKSPTALVSPDGLPASQIALTYDQYGHGILTWGNQIYSRMYYALVDGSGSVLTPPMIQRSAAPGSSHIDLGLSIYSSAFLADPIDWGIYLPMVNKLIAPPKNHKQYLSIMRR